MASRSGSKDERRDPVVAALIASGDSHQTLLDVPEPRGQILDAMLMLVESGHGKVAVQDALAAAERVPPTGHDPDLYLAFLECWTGAANRADRIAEMSSLLARAKSLINDRTPLELRADLLLNEALLAAKLGNMAENERLCRSALAGLSRQSGSYAVGCISLARCLAWMGRGNEVAASLDDFPEPKRRRHANGIVATRMTDAAICGRMAETARLLKAVSPASAVQTFYKAPLELARAMLRLMLCRWETPDTAAARSELTGQSFLDAPEAEWHDWELVTDRLAHRQPDEALRLTREMAARGVERFLNEYGFDAYSLARAELSAGNGPAARRIIEIRRRRGNRQYLDDFFLARAELLAGRLDEAARLFAAAHRACERYDALGRLDFELHLSCELSAGRASFLMREAARRERDSTATAGTSSARAPSPSGDAARPEEVRTGPARLLGTSQVMARVRDDIERLAPLAPPLLIVGETGTGKELAARAIHEAGARAAGPFVAVNCGAITEGLLESELFGHERGAFTGAERAHRGLFEEAGKGTILLDEIGEIPPRLQVALLRVLESGEIRPVGSARSRKIACRVIGATNADLAALVERGRFRQDLFYRLRHLELRMPPLRDRREDIAPLTEHFLAEGRADGGKPSISAALAEELRTRRWPGNVRELRNVIERMRLLNSDKRYYDVADLEAEPAAPEPAGTETEPAQSRQSPAEISPSPDVRSTPSGEAAELAVLNSERTMMRQLERLRSLFARHRQLTRKEIGRLLDVAPATAAKYLKALRADGTVDKVAPSASPRSHYFRLRG